MSDDYTPDEIKALIRAAFGLQIQRPKTGLVATNADGSNPAAQEWHIPVKVDGQEETYEAGYNPLLDATALARNSAVDIILNYEGGYEVTGLNAILGRAAYSGTTPTANYAFSQHNHEDATGGGQLNASLIFDEGAVPAIYGGTGQSVYAVGDLLYASSTTALSKLADVATGNALISGGVSTAPAWGKVGLTTHVSGTLPVANGGTGAATLTANNVILGNGTSAVQFVAPGTSGNVLTSNGTTWTSAAPASSGGWTDDGTVVRLTTSTDNVTIGSALNIAKLGIVGDTDEVQLIVRGNATQTSNIFDVQNSTPASLFKITSSAIIINDDSLSRDFRIESDGDANAFFLTGSNGRVGLGTNSPDALLRITGSSDITQLKVSGATGQTLNPVVAFTDDVGTGLFTFFADGTTTIQGTLTINGAFGNLGGGAVFNELGSDVDFRIESDTQANAFFLDGATGAIQQLGNAPAAYHHMAASTTALASSRMPVGTAPTSPGAGDEWHNSSRNAMYSYQGGMTHGDCTRIYGQYSTVGGSNTTSPIALIGGSTIGTATIPADMWFAGRAFKLEAKGYISTGGIARDITITVALGGTTLVSQTLTGLSIVTLGRMWWLDLDFVCQTTGSSGTVFSQAFGSLFNTLLDRFENTATSTHNMTGNLALTFSFTFATANSNTQIQCTNLNLYAIH